MTQAQIQLQNALTTTFLANMVFLNEYDNELYQRVDNLSKMLEDGSYKARYELEFVMENGDFDIFDTARNIYLYGKNPKKLNDDLVKEITKDGRKSIFNVEGYFKHKNTPTIDFKYEHKGEFSSIIHKMMMEYSSVTGDYLSQYKEKIYKEIKKFVFFGSFLGRHIPRITNKMNSSIYLLIEESLEIFRLSLFTVDYTILAKNNGVIFSVMDDLIDIEIKINRFLDIGHLENYLIKFSVMGSGSHNMYDIFLSNSYARKPSGYDFTRYLYHYINKTTTAIKDGYKFLLFNKIQKDLTIFEDLPVLYLAAGPSLDENIEWIKENQDRFFIVTIGSVYGKLLKNGIKVDLVTTVDEQKWLKTKQFSDDILEKSDKNTMFFASTFTTKKILEGLKDKNLYLYETYETFFNENICFSGYSIGELTMEMILALNAKNIYLIGLDLTINQETGETHSSDASSGISRVKIDEERDIEKRERKSLISVKGNLIEEVKSIEIYYGSIKEVEKKLANKKDDVKVYNLSKTGAFFEGAQPLKIEDLDIHSLKKIEKNSLNMSKIMDKFSQIYLENSEKETHRLNIEFLNSEIKTKLKNLKEKKVTNYTELNDDLLDIIKEVGGKDIMTFYKVLFNYYEIVMPYLNYYFNEARIKQEYKKLNGVKDVFVKQLEFLLDEYIFCMNRVI
ncbi:motility associated factor glycosyltransferase family protein [Aliarcobacter skirrowii]|uniref:motility associated factor glycosyltransferase family protein n=1 Tax=Aliarcobacter skirrowii TaxID=28200 RepID=UPI0029B564FB|nr:6-hydroxymethylpterin diphosphokinase MptE-like protein [Aliarcobacter skirrowii]MDX4038851.1 DUF115 domain-containing protein [Aliarcobacter skirrowii]